MNRISKNRDKLFVILGSALVAFAIYNIHSKVHIAEGGNLGIELLIYNWFKISPAIVSLVIDVSAYILGYIILGKRFLLNAIIGTISYSLFYFIFELFPPILPNLSNNLLLASILGGCLVGIGCGLVVRMNGATGFDDCLSLIISKVTKLPIALCYFIFDFIVILLSLSYIKVDIIAYSLLTALISSLLIGYIQKCKIIKRLK